MKKFLSVFLSTVFAVLSLSALSAFLTVSFGCDCNGKAERSSYVIDCEYSDGVLTGVETVTFYNFTENAFSELKFNLFGNAFRKGAKFSPISNQYESKAYYNGDSFGDMQIHSVKSLDKDLEFSVCGEDENVLKVCLSEEVFPEESVSVTIAFTLNLAEVIARTGVNKKTVNLANFYPVLCGISDQAFYENVYYSNGDPFFSDCSDYTVNLTADSSYVVASSGKVVSEIQKGSKKTVTYKLDNARSFAFVLCKDFEAIKDGSTGVEITYYYYDDSNPVKSLKTAVQAVKYFSEAFGEFAYQNYAVVETQFIQGGMEYPALVMISDELEERAYLEVIAHETAHQWWQTAVGNNETEYGFLDEGLAEYSVVLFYEKYPEYGYERKNLVQSAEKSYKVFCSVYDKVFGKVNTTMIRSLKDFDSEYEYVNIAYIKPTVMYDMLRTSIGDDKFFEGLKRYYDENKFKNATPDDLVGAFERANANTNGYFDGFFNGKVII